MKVGTLLIGILFVIVLVVGILPAVTSTIGRITVQEAIALLSGRGYMVLGQGSEISGDLTPSANNTYDIGSNARQWKELFVASGTIHLGGVELTDSGGCLATGEFRAEGRDSIAGYLKMAYGTAPTHVEADHGILWADASEIIYFQTDTGANLEIIRAGEDNIASISMLQLNSDLVAPAHSEGLIFYEPIENTVAYYNDEADVTLNIGQETWLYVRNDTGSTIADGKVVYISGVVGNRPNIALAQANATATSSAIGVTTHSIEDGTSGYVTTYGIVHEQNTSTLNAGDIIYLSATTAGSATVTPPSFPNFVVKIAIVTVVDVSEGEVLIVPDRIDYTSKVVLDSLNVLDTVSIGMNTPTSPLQVSGLPIYGNNTAAITGGLTAGAFYRDNGDPDKVCVVH